MTAKWSSVVLFMEVDLVSDGLTVALGGFVGVESQQDGFEAGEGLAEGDAREIDAGEDGAETEDDELEAWVGGLEGVVEPTAEMIIAGA
ncbi:hypothetical protein U1Q18_009598 [Sarracenia purpurea var. burkii]